MTESQIEIIKKLNDLKKEIQKKSDLESISYLIRAVIHYVEQNAKLDDQIQITLIDQLNIEEQQVIKNIYSSIKDLRFQISASIAQLMISISGEGIDEINKVLEKK